MPEQIQKIFKKTHLRYEKEFIVIDFIYLNKSNEYCKKFSELLLKVEKEELNKNRKINPKLQKRGLLINPLDFYYDDKTEKWKQIYLSDDDKLKFDNQELF